MRCFHCGSLDAISAPKHKWRGLCLACAWAGLPPPPRYIPPRPSPVVDLDAQYNAALALVKSSSELRELRAQLAIVQRELHQARQQHAASIIASAPDCDEYSPDDDMLDLAAPWPSDGEIQAAIDAAAWQYGACSAMSIAEQVGKGLSDFELEDLALQIASRLDEDSAWEHTGNTGSESSYQYDETRAWEVVSNLSDLPADCSAAHADEMRKYLAWRAENEQGYYSRRAQYLRGPLAQRTAHSHGKR